MTDSERIERLERTNRRYYEIDGRSDTIKSITTLSKHDPFFHELYNFKDRQMQKVTTGL